MTDAPNITVRKAAPADCKAIQGLANQLGYAVTEVSILRHIESPEPARCVFVADDENEGVVGWIEIIPRKLLIYEQSTPWAEIGGLVVDKAHHHRGIGRQLIKKAEDWCWQSGYHGIVIRSNTKRDAAHEFYPSLGYRHSHDQAIYVKTEPN